MAGERLMIAAAFEMRLSLRLVSAGTGAARRCPGPANMRRRSATSPPVRAL